VQLQTRIGYCQSLQELVGIVLVRSHNTYITIGK